MVCTPEEYENFENSSQANLITSPSKYTSGSVYTNVDEDDSSDDYDTGGKELIRNNSEQPRSDNKDSRMQSFGTQGLRKDFETIVEAESVLEQTQWQMASNTNLDGDNTIKQKLDKTDDDDINILNIMEGKPTQRAATVSDTRLSNGGNSALQNLLNQ